MLYSHYPACVYNRITVHVCGMPLYRVNHHAYVHVMTIIDYISCFILFDSYKKVSGHADLLAKQS